MATTYNGNAGGVSLGVGTAITIPADGVDPLAVSTVNTPMQKLADYVEAIRAQYASQSASVFGIFNFGGSAPNTASVINVMWNSGAQLTLGNTMGTSTSNNNDQFSLMVPAACILKQVAIRHHVATAGGAINIVVHKIAGFVGSAISTTVVPAGDAPSVRTAISVNVALAAGDLVYVTHEAQTGVTGGGGVWQVAAHITTA